MSYDGTSTLDTILNRGSLRIAVEFNDPPDSGFPPEMYIDPETGEPWGMAPIMGGLVAKDLGVDLECVDIPWPNQIGALLSGQVDLLPKLDPCQCATLTPGALISSVDSTLLNCGTRQSTRLAINLPDT